MTEIKIETRSVRAQLRAESQGNDMALVGYAALFNTESKDLGGFKESISPSAFVRSLRQGATVFCLFNHDANQVLGSTKSGTLALSQDQTGLKFRCSINCDDHQATAIYSRVKRGDLDSCSFAFTVPQGGDVWSTDGSKRTLLDVDLQDVSVCCYPAYPDTSVGARSRKPGADYSSNIPAESLLRAKAARFAKEILECRKRDEKLAREIESALNCYGYRLLDIDEDVSCAYGANDTMDENDALRFGYELDDQGNVTVDTPARARKVSHLWVSSERGQELKRLAELRFRMRAAAGLPGRK